MLYTFVMQSKATTVEQYLAELPPDRRAAIEAVRNVILKNLDKDCEEAMSYGMIGYGVPHRVYPPGYHCDPSKPLPFAGIASQKNYMSVYLCTVYAAGIEEDWFRAAWAKTGKKLDMGKCCIRFKKLDDLALDVIGQAIRRVPARKFVELYEAGMLTMNKRAASKRGATGKKQPARKKSKTASAKSRATNSAKKKRRSNKKSSRAR